MQIEYSDSRRWGKLDEITKHVDFSLFFWGGIFRSHFGVQPPGALVLSSGLLMHPHKPK